MYSVNISNGEFNYFAVDFFISGLIPIEFRRTYKTSLKEKGSSLGCGWSHSLNRYLEIKKGKILYSIGGDKEIEFDLPQIDKPTDNESQALKLTYLNGEYILFSKVERHRWIFSRAEGKRNLLLLRRMEDLNHNTIHFTYDLRGLLKRIIDPFKRNLFFYYYSDDRLKEIKISYDNSGSSAISLVKYKYSSQ